MWWCVLLWGCCGVVDSLVFGFGVVDGARGWEVRKRLHGLYPKRKRSFCDSILTDAPAPTIQETVYLILVFQVIQQPKKIG